MGNRVGEETTHRIAIISVNPDAGLVIDAIDPAVQEALAALIEKQMQAGGFAAQVGRYEPSDEQPEAHVTYVIKQDPHDAHFDWALESVASMYWTGQRAGNYEINGFGSYIDNSND
jgi:hypothetical protein